MNSGILLTVNLSGKIGGPVKHVDKQNVTIDIAPIGSKFPEWVSRKITHTDRPMTECCRKCTISEDIVRSWGNADCPYWERPAVWKGYSKNQKIAAFLSRYDEGFGISYEFIENEDEE